jgi:hypothetical protein
MEVARGCENERWINLIGGPEVGSFQDEALI